MVLNCLWNFFALFRQIMHDLMPVLHDWILRGFYLVYCYVRGNCLYHKAILFQSATKGIRNPMVYFNSG